MQNHLLSELGADNPGSACGSTINERTHQVPLSNSSVARISANITSNPIPAPERQMTFPSNPATSSLQQPNFDTSGHFDHQDPLNSNDPLRTTDLPQNPPAELAVPLPTRLSTATSPVNNSHPTPAQPHLSGRESTQRTRHRRRFVRWVKKRFWGQAPWSTNFLHSDKEAERALKRADSQGLTSGKPQGLGRRERHRKSR